MSEGPLPAQGPVDLLVMRFLAWRRRRNLARLYRSIWYANEIILRERYVEDAAMQNSQFWQELNACADALERAAASVRRELGKTPNA